MNAIQHTADYYRCCPGEEQIRISNAVCRGRRRASFPKCHGCQYNEEEKNRSAGGPAGDRAMAAAAIEAVFQTHEICATAPNPLSEDVAWRIGHAAAQYLRGKLRGCDRADPNARSIVVGRDARTHSLMLQQALIEGIRASGMDVVNLGMIDTPQLAFAINRFKTCGGIQTSAGHRPADYGGFKICGAKGVPISLETGLASIRDIATRVPKHQTGTTARLTDQDLSGPYRDFIQGFLNDRAGLARRLKVLVDASNGMAGRWLPIVFGGFKKLTLVPMNFEHTGFFAHDPDPLVARNTRNLRKAVKEQKADFGVCFDGDADRCLFVDEKGTTVAPDLITALLARRFAEREPGATIVYDLRCSRVIAEEVERAGAVPIRERVGHTLMKKSMTQRNAIFGGDLEGRFFFRDNFFCESALLAFAHVLNVLSDTGRRLSELIRHLQRYRSSGEVVFDCEDREQALQEIIEAHRDADIDELDGLTVKYPDWWFNVRAVGDEPCLRIVVECRTRKLIDQKLAQLQALFSPRVPV